MENIDNMAKNSLTSFSKDLLTQDEKKRIKSDVVKAVTALCCVAIGLAYTFIFPENDIVPALFYTVGFIIEGIPIIFVALKGVMKKELNNAMEMLVAMAILACYFTGELILAILIPVILNVAHFLEERSIVGGREVIEGLRKLNKNTAILLENGEEKEVSAKSLKKGQLIVVKPGAGVPIDGTVVKGKTSIDQKSLTGEPIPAFAQEGSTVYAGTVNIEGQIIVRVDKEYVDTSFSKILNLLEEAENISTPESRLIDRFMKYYIPFVLVMAVAVALFSSDISKAIAILVVSCPCGQMLVSSAPMIAALSVAIKRGILIKNSKFIEELTDVDAVVFDKTGTITKGELSITNIKVANGVSEKELLKAAMAVSYGSNHPISRTLKANVHDLDFIKTLQVSEVSGAGLVGKSEDELTTVLFGNMKLMQDNFISIPDDFIDDLAGTVSFICVNKKFLGYICFNDTPREEAKQSISELKKLGTQKVVVLTGDTQESANAICENMGIDEVNAQLMPIDKLNTIKQIKKDYTVLAVGDGINDALALKDADVGIAMGAMGSDLAIQSADIALMNNNLENIPFAVKLANQTKNVIYQNLTLSCLISLTMIVLSAVGAISVLAGSILHNLGAFTVLLNSSRILKTELWYKKES